MELTHVTKDGVRMVDVSEKKEVKRVARARGRIYLKPSTVEKVLKGRVEKGNVLTTSQVAATLSVKKTPELIPMCHPLPITGITVNFENGKNYIDVVVEVSTVAKTGIEMEAITGVSTALLTIWDMVKAIEKDREGQYPCTKITDIVVEKKIKGE